MPTGVSASGRLRWPIPSKIGTPTFRFRPDADLVTLTGANLVTAFTALNGPNGTAGTTSPTWNPSVAAFGGRPTISLVNGTTQSLISGTFTQAQPDTVIIVFRNSATVVIPYDGRTGRQMIQTSSGGASWQIYAGSFSTGQSVGATSAVQVFAVVYNSPNSAFYVNNSQTPVGTGLTTNTNSITGGMIIGSSQTVNPITGDIAELIVYPGVLTSTQLAFLFGDYIAPYYNLPGVS